MRPPLAAALLLLHAALAAQTPVVTFAGDSMRLRSARVVATGGNQFDVTLTMENDNANAALASSFRRWWHCEIGSIPAGATLHVTVDNAGYSDVILPVWALSSDGGATFGSYARCPTSATPVVGGGGTTHSFTLSVPPGVDALRLAKYFPYPVARKDAWLQTLLGRPQVRSIAVLGSSPQGRPLHRIEFTDGSVPDAGKARIWIHAGAHPSETTSYFTVEGLVDWLCSGDPYAAVLLDHALIDIVPMANPDGVYLGNYRVNANSANLEEEWAAPYASVQPEIVAMRTAIEQYMGTVAVPATNPIEVLLNLHSSHNIAYPFHYQHTANAAWDPVANNSGVLPIVNQREGQWIAFFRARSPFANLGVTLSSTAGAPSRPFVESMMHDRWTAVNGWLNAPGLQQPVMAITFEGTYGRGPDQTHWNTEADYRLCGAQLGRALCDYFGLQLTASAQPYGQGCAPAVLGCLLQPSGNGGHLATLSVAGAPANAFVWLVMGLQQQSVPLPSPWSQCNLLCTLDATVGLLANALGMAQFALTVPPWPGLVAHFQAVTADLSLAPSVPLATSNGVTVRNDY